jgi:hypothetical protein
MGQGKVKTPQSLLLLEIQLKKKKNTMKAVFCLLLLSRVMKRADF